MYFSEQLLDPIVDSNHHSVLADSDQYCVFVWLKVAFNGTGLRF